MLSGVLTLFGNTKNVIKNNELIKMKNIDEQDANGETQLMHIIKYHNLKPTAKYLIDMKCNIHLKNKVGENALMIAVQHGNMEIVKYLIDHKCDMNSTDKNGSTVLSHAMKYYDHTNSREIVKYLIDHKCNMDIIDKDGSTALSRAINYSKEDIVNKLLDSKCNVINNKGLLNSAIKNRLSDIALKLISSGCNINEIDGNEWDKKNPLFNSIYNDLPEITDKLIEMKCDLEQKSGDVTILMYSLWSKKYDIAKKLIEAKCDTYSVYTNNVNALIYSISQDEDIANKIIDVQSLNNNTSSDEYKYSKEMCFFRPLMKAIKHNKMAIIVKLLKIYVDNDTLNDPRKLFIHDLYNMPYLFDDVMWYIDYIIDNYIEHKNINFLELSKSHKKKKNRIKQYMYSSNKMGKVVQLYKDTFNKILNDDNIFSHSYKNLGDANTINIIIGYII
ncbi:MAG: hypothetical protein Edafosvirus2_51 [Edafosvirus sp.]|uniref:Uncharacterized protein n=1 Tax=Edafosvirus sp. TaxID=2487765 RepID=A0A3G4ZSI2_9VIRU|nr:MAG: hypothetical protein Edafosvirus2_51 [Edafosvirus sp.]